MRTTGTGVVDARPGCASRLFGPFDSGYDFAVYRMAGGARLWSRP